jgi:hypothetical protein
MRRAIVPTRFGSCAGPISTMTLSACLCKFSSAAESIEQLLNAMFGDYENEFQFHEVLPTQGGGGAEVGRSQGFPPQANVEVHANLEANAANP